MFINTSGHREAPLAYYMGVVSWNIKKGPSRDLSVFSLLCLR